MVTTRAEHLPAAAIERQSQRLVGCHHPDAREDLAHRSPTTAGRLDAGGDGKLVVPHGFPVGLGGGAFGCCGFGDGCCGLDGE
jgi:hypothetical protein